MSDNFSRSYDQIIHEITQFALPIKFGDARIYSYHKFFPEEYATIGDLVCPKATRRPDEWMFSWLLDIDDSDEYAVGRKYLLKSCRTGKECWYSNIGLSVFDRDKIKTSWKWNDKQWMFCDKWIRTGSKHYNSTRSILRVLYPDFGDNYEVTIKSRKRWASSENDYYEKSFDDYRKVTIKMMKETLSEMDNT